MKATDLIPDEANANRHTERGEKMVSDSIAKYKFRFAGTVDKNNRIVHGNNRHDKATKQGLDEAILIDADPSKQYYLKFNDLDLADPANPAREISIAANRTGQVSIDFDPATILAHLDAGIDLGRFWREDELKEILRELETIGDGEDAEPQIDRAAELQAKWGTALGQVWQLGEHHLAVGDCTDKAVVEAVMRRERVDLMVTDPPYGVQYDPYWRVKSGHTERTHGAKIQNDDIASWLEAYKLFPGKIAYIWHASSMTHIVASDLSACGFDVESGYVIVWNKDLAVFGRGDYHWKHELCRYVWQKGETHNYIGGRKETTVWDIPTINSFANGRNADEWGLLGHGNQKPLECMARPIRNHDSELVYDPFVGSGTTIIACEKLKRKCRAIEIDPAYCGVAIQRWVDLTGKEPALL